MGDVVARILHRDELANIRQEMQKLRRTIMLLGVRYSGCWYNYLQKKRG